MFRPPVPASLDRTGRSQSPCECRWTPGIDLPTYECEQHQDDPSLAHRGRSQRAVRDALMVLLNRLHLHEQGIRPLTGEEIVLVEDLDAWWKASGNASSPLDGLTDEEREDYAEWIRLGRPKASADASGWCGRTNVHLSHGGCGGVSFERHADGSTTTDDASR